MNTTTTCSFRIVGLPLESYTPLFALSDAALAERGIRCVIAESKPGCFS